MRHCLNELRLIFRFSSVFSSPVAAKENLLDINQCERGQIAEIIMSFMGRIFENIVKHRREWEEETMHVQNS